ncbi:MAG: hypothetical protein ABW185_17290, partial [Sedimenticola sp.]
HLDLLPNGFIAVGKINASGNVCGQRSTARLGIPCNRLNQPETDNVASGQDDSAAIPPPVCKPVYEYDCKFGFAIDERGCPTGDCNRKFRFIQFFRRQFGTLYGYMVK